MDPLPTLEDDGLYTPEVGDWAERKYLLISYYAEMFSTSMKDKWGQRVYIDPFAGAGRGRIKGTSRVIPTSALLALDVRNPFDRYIFCDSDPECVGALRERVLCSHPDRDVRYLTGDANQLVEAVLGKIPRGTTGASVLSFCMLDPCNLSNLKFRLIERLSATRVDFLVLIPSYMDAHRNEKLYSGPDNTTVAEFIGNENWRGARRQARGDFGTFIVDQFGLSMKRLGFIYNGLGEEVVIYLPEKNRQLYHLAFYSRSKLAMRLWREARKYSTPQLELFQ
jgi:three-Cys-motif partner protein